MSARGLTEGERVAIAANARGEDVYCGDDAGALTIARGASDRDSEWSDEATVEATAIARRAWLGSREVQVTRPAWADWPEAAGLTSEQMERMEAAARASEVQL